MDRLEDALELLDGPLDDAAVLEGNLRDLARVNRWLGGIALSSRAIEALAPNAAVLTMLDVGTGGADIPFALLERAQHAGRSLTVTAIDSRSEVIAAAAVVNPKLGNTRGLILETGDGLSLGFPNASFDIAHCSLLLHHLDEDEAIAMMREMARVARMGIVINDLDRTRLDLFGARLLARVATRNAYTRTDGPLSVQRAYRAPELVQLLRTAGLRPIRIFRAPFRHRYSIAAVAGKPAG